MYKATVKRNIKNKAKQKHNQSKCQLLKKRKKKSEHQTCVFLEVGVGRGVDQEGDEVDVALLGGVDERCVACRRSGGGEVSER